MNKVNVSEITIRTYNGNREPAFVGALPTRSFTDKDGDFIGGGNIKTVDKDWIVKVAVAETDPGVYVSESFTGDNALSATRWLGVDQSVKWNFYLLDSELRVLKTLYTNIVLADTVETTTIQDAEILSRGRYFPTRTNYPSFDDLNTMLAGIQTTPDATTVTKGKVTLSNSGTTKAVADNDTRVPDDLSKYSNSLATYVSNIAILGTPKKKLTINDITSPSGNVTVPENITVEFGNGGKIAPATGVSVTINKMTDPGNRDVFDVSASNSKVLFGRTVTEHINIAWLCGTANGTDATRAINLALESCANNDGGKIYIPGARYVSSGGHIIPKATTIAGNGDFITIGYGGSAITLTNPTEDYLFKIGETTYDTGISHMTLAGSEGSGLLLEGDGALNNSASGKCSIEGVTFSGFDYGINYNTLSNFPDNTWQMAQVSLKDFRFIGCTTGIRQTSVNSSWAFENGTFYTDANGFGLDIEDGGIMNFKSVEFAGNGNTNTTSVRISGAHVNMNFMGCQEEGSTTFIQNDASDESGIINLVGNLIQSKIQLNATCVINSYGNNYLSKVFKFGGVGTICRITSIGDHVQERDVADGVTVVSPAVLTEGGINDIHIVLQQSVEAGRFKQRSHGDVISTQVQTGNPTVPLRGFGYVYDGGAGEDKVLLRLGRMTTNEVFDFYYDIYRKFSTGWLHFEGNQVNPFKGFFFNAPVEVPNEAYDEESWNGNLTVPTKNAVRDKIELLDSLKANLAGATFSGNVAVPDDPYGSGWNGSANAPTKNAIYDKIEALILEAAGGADYYVTSKSAGATGNGTTDDTANLQTAINNAISTGKTFYWMPGTYRTTATLRWKSGLIQMKGAGAGRAVLKLDSNTYHGLWAGGHATDSPATTEIGEQTKIIEGFEIRCDAAPPAVKNMKAGLLMDQLYFTEVRNLTISGFDIGIDMVRNSYGASFHNLNLGRYGSCNVGLNLRGFDGVYFGSGSDIPVYNCWIGGRVAGVHISGSGGGYHFYGGQITCNANLLDGGNPVDTAGGLVMGKDYETGTLGECDADLHGTSFEGVGRAWLFRGFDQINLRCFGCSFNPADRYSNPAIGVLKSDNMKGGLVSFVSCTIGGGFSSASLLTRTGTVSGGNWLTEIGTYSPAEYPRIEGNDGQFVNSMAAYSGITSQTAGFSRHGFMIGDMLMRKSPTGQRVEITDTYADGYEGWRAIPMSKVDDPSSLDIGNVYFTGNVPKSYTATVTDFIPNGYDTIYVNSSNPTTQTLPLASAYPVDREVTVINIGTGVVTLATQSGHTINGSAASLTLNQYERVTLKVLSGTAFIRKY